jgi:ribosomal protein S18 acetylase RimI-like enzyme
VSPPDLRIETPDVTECEAVLDCWVALAEEQRDRGSTIGAEPNREAMHATLLRKIATGDLLVARPADAAGADAADHASALADDIRGFVTFEVVRGRYAETANRGRIGNLWVAPDHRGQGIGTRLLEAAEDRLADAGVAVVGLEALADNDAARAFYRDRGYDPHRVEYRRRTETDRPAPDADS